MTRDSGTGLEDNPNGSLYGRREAADCECATDKHGSMSPVIGTCCVQSSSASLFLFFSK
jgi:hypothetical protein